MEKDKVFTYEPKMRANLELIMDIMRYDCDYVVYKDKQIADLEAKLAESEKKESKKNDESWDLYLSLKQFYSRLGVEAYADDEIQDVAVKELNRLLNENEQLKQQLAEKDEEIDNQIKQLKELK